MAINEEAKKKVSRIRAHKKVWYKIISPKVFGQKELGEAYLTSPQVAVGRTLKVNLKDLTGNVKDQNSYAVFRIVKLIGTQLHSASIGYEMTSSYVKRMVRKNADRLDDYIACTTQDGKNVIIKTVMITHSKTHRSTQAQLRKLLATLLQEETSKGDFDSFVGSVASYKVQSGLKKRLNKIYPLKEVALRSIVLTEQPTGEMGDKQLPEEKLAEAMTVASN